MPEVSFNPHLCSGKKSSRLTLEFNAIYYRLFYSYLIYNSYLKVLSLKKSFMDLFGNIPAIRNLINPLN